MKNYALIFCALLVGGCGAWFFFKRNDSSILEQEIKIYLGKSKANERRLKALELKGDLLTKIVKTKSDSLKFERQRNKRLYEKYIRLRNSSNNLVTDAQLDSAINRLIGQP